MHAFGRGARIYRKAKSRACWRGLLETEWNYYFRRRKISKLARPRPRREAEAGSGTMLSVNPASEPLPVGATEFQLEDGATPPMDQAATAGFGAGPPRTIDVTPDFPATEPEPYVAPDHARICRAMVVPPA